MDACLLSLQVREERRGTARIPGDRKLALISAPMFAEQKAAGASGSGSWGFQAREHLREPLQSQSGRQWLLAFSERGGENFLPQPHQPCNRKAIAEKK